MNKFSVAVAGLALASAQPITYPGYVDPHKEGFDFEYGTRLLNDCESMTSNGREAKCAMSRVLRSQPGMPSTRDYLAMFSDKYVENNGRFYAVKNSQGNGAMTMTDIMRNGLYEIIVPDTFVGMRSCNTSGKCVQFNLLMEADNIGQIIAAPARYDPIQVIGVDQVTNRIYGYYPTDSDSGWDRKRTVWGKAKDGSMRSFDKAVIGLSTKDRVSVNGCILILHLHFCPTKTLTSLSFGHSLPTSTFDYRCLVSGETSTMPIMMTFSVLLLRQPLMNGLVTWRPIEVVTALQLTIINCGRIRGTRVASRWKSSIGRLPRRSLVLKVAFVASLLMGGYLSFGMTVALFAAFLLIYPTFMVSELLVGSKISMYGAQACCSPTKMIKFTMFTGEMAVGRKKKLLSTSPSQAMRSRNYFVCQYYLVATMARFTCFMGGMITSMDAPTVP